MFDNEYKVTLIQNAAAQTESKVQQTVSDSVASTPKQGIEQQRQAIKEESQKAAKKEPSEQQTQQKSYIKIDTAKLDELLIPSGACYSPKLHSPKR